VDLLAGRYRLVEPLGQGGEGTVWRAHDELLRREVAVKQMRVPAHLSPGELAEYTGRALQEARAAGRLSHPSIVMIHDVVPHNGQPWIIMDLVPGTSLDKLLPLPANRVAEIGLSILDALELAHHNGILHRDVKPANVLIGADGRAMLADFGIAAPLGSDPADSSGSPAYMAPERFRREPAGPPSDLWSLGATLYTAVEGRGPFHREIPAAVVAAVLMHEPPPMIRATPGLARVILALLDKDPSRRPPAPAARHLLQSLLPPPVVVRPRRTGRFVAIGALTVALGVAAGLAAWNLGGQDTPGRFTALPDPCEGITTRQANELLGDGADRGEQNGASCGWAQHRTNTTLTITYHLNPAEAGENHAARAFDDYRSGGGENFTLAQDAFTRNISEPGVTGTSVWFRQSNLIVEVAYRQSGVAASAASERSPTWQAATHAATLVSVGLG
jgi:tRNA A-37 threonylcarbamoyl transferase component Bud32